ncbi:hypothetical protein T09_1883 [Trichinella sp. T9]|nr:hypothetical protein T09_1883 [Trichinella sp. T9]
MQIGGGNVRLFVFHWRLSCSIVHPCTSFLNIQIQTYDMRGPVLAKTMVSL